MTLTKNSENFPEYPLSSTNSFRQFVGFNILVWVCIEGVIRVSQSVVLGKPTVYLLIDLSDTLIGFVLCFAIRPVLSRYVKTISIHTVLVAFTCSLCAAIIWHLVHTEVYIAVFPQEPRAESFLQSLSGLRFPFYLFLVWCAAFAFWQNNVLVSLEQKRRLQAEKMGKQAILRNLQAQLAPHFVFNTLNAAYALAIEEGASKTQKQLYTMADLIRYSTNVSASLFSPLQQEWKFAQGYLALEQSRFGDRLDILLNIADDIDTSIEIPTMILQPLLENAIVHNVACSMDTVLLEMMIKRQNHMMLLTVRNSVPTDVIASVQNSMGSSLQNLTQRLEVLYEGKASLETTATGGSFDVAIRLPLDRIK